MTTMKRLLLLIGLLSFFGCKEETDLFPVLEDLIEDYRRDDAIRLEISSNQVILDPQFRRDQALLVTWEPLTEIEAQYPVKYLFKMDLTENNFTTSTPTIEIPEGEYFKTFTHDELQNLIRSYWKKVEIDPISISVRVIAQVSSEEKYIIPLYSTLDVSVTPYQLTSSSLFVYGSATGLSNMIEMDEAVPGEIYAWRGRLSPGAFKIATIMDQSYPAYGKGEEDAVILLDSEDEGGNDFVVEKEGIYSILLDRTSKRINIEEVRYMDVYFGGSATPTAWNNPPAMEWNVFKPNICTITTTLTAATVNTNGSYSGGELKFSTESNFSSGTQQLRPWQAQASILSDFDVQESSAPDWKWLVKPGESGQYKVVLDIKSMKVQFIKID
jgi:hypothetical protein